MKDLNSKSLRKFKNGQLVFAVLRPYQGKGKPKVILHEAVTLDDGAFGYGHKGHWVLSPVNKKRK